MKREIWLTKEKRVNFVHVGSTKLLAPQVITMPTHDILCMSHIMLFE